MSSARKDEHSHLAQSAEKLQLVEEISALSKENETFENLRGSLKSENELLKGKVSEQEETIAKMQEKMNLDEGVLENLRSVVEKDAAKVVTSKLRFASSRLMLRRKMVQLQDSRNRSRKTERYGSRLPRKFRARAPRFARNTARPLPFLVLSLRPFLRMQKGGLRFVGLVAG